MQSAMIPIPEADVTAQYLAAEEMLVRASKGARAQPGIVAFQYASPILDKTSMTTPQSSGLMELFSANGGVIPTAEEHAVLYALKRGLAAGLAIGNWFGGLKGLDELLKRNRVAPLIGGESATMTALVSVWVWLVTYTMAAYVAQSIAADATADGKADQRLSVDEALMMLMSRLAQRNGVPVQTTVSVWANEVLKTLRANATTELGAYRAQLMELSIGLESGDFSLVTLNPGKGSRATGKVIIPVKKPHEIIGNHIAKAQAIRLAKMLVSYDFKTQTNPFVTLGGFVFTVMGDGEPGTGKTSIIQMVCGLLRDYCEVAGYDWGYENFSVSEISDYQGRSGHNARQFINRVMDPSRIAFGSIDDVDQVAGKRDNERNSSIGQQEVTAVLMNAFSGVDTVIRGNCAFGMFSNHPDKIDDALRQRAAGRWLIDGPQTEQDYIDILSLMLGNAVPGPTNAKTINMQRAEPYTAHSVPLEAKLRNVFDGQVRAGADFSKIEDIGRYLFAISRMDKRFTGRAIKNITNAVMMRSLDIELPERWFENPEPFLHQPVETKLSMLKELQKPVTGQMIIEEVNRYADSELRFVARSDEAEIENRVRLYDQDDVARQRFLAAKGSTT